jgi:hypothetical protein
MMIGTWITQRSRLAFYICNWVQPFIIQCTSYTSSQNKNSIPILQAMCSQWQKRAQQTFLSDLTRVSVPTEDGS